MGFMEAVRAFFGGERHTPLVDYPAEVETYAVESLEVRTVNLSADSDEKMVVIALSAAALGRAAAAQGPVRLAPQRGRPVTFVPVDFAANPALDPTYGWIVPVTGETRAELRGLPDGPGEYELRSIHLGIVVEG